MESNTALCGQSADERPLAIDLFTGLHGWAEGLIAEGFRVVGFDLEDMSSQFGQPRPKHFNLVIQDVLTLHGSQFKGATLIVASPPCQEFSYMAMPWKLAKAKAAAIRADTTGESLVKLNRLFNACFRIQAEASLAAGRHIPMVVENVRGAIPWVGRSRWNFGSFHLWGDVPALMPPISKIAPLKHGIAHRSDGATNFHRDLNNGKKVPGFRFDGSGKSFQSASVEATGRKGKGSWFGDYDAMKEGIKQGGDWFNQSQPSISRLYGSKSPQRKMASAMIAKIPFPLSRHIAATFREPEASKMK